jgi:carbon monoxide dehydrogenase subunit G
VKDYSISVQIDAPPGQVWPVMSDVERWHEWTPTITSVRRTNAGPFRIGARARIHQPKLPPADWVVTSLEEGRSFDWESRAPGVRVVGRHRVDPGPTGSRVTLSIQYSGVIGNLLGRMIGSISRRYIALEADGLKRRVEGRVHHA